LGWAVFKEEKNVQTRKKNSGRGEITFPSSELKGKAEKISHIRKPKRKKEVREKKPRRCDLKTISQMLKIEKSSRTKREEKGKGGWAF